MIIIYNFNKNLINQLKLNLFKNKFNYIKICFYLYNLN